MFPLASCHSNLVHLKTPVRCCELNVLVDHGIPRTHVSSCSWTTHALGIVLWGYLFRVFDFGPVGSQQGGNASLKTPKSHRTIKYILTLVDWILSFNWFVALLLPNRSSLATSLLLCAFWWLVRLKGKKIQLPSIQSFYRMMSCRVSQFLNWFFLCTSCDIRDAKGDIK